MAEDQALRHAMEVAQRQLLDAEAELREVQERVRNLRAVVYGLKQIFEPGDVGRLPEAIGAAVTDEAQVQRGSRVTRAAMASATVRRAVQLLAEVDRPMRMAEITDEWHRRGWVNPAWKTPKSAINMIYQRALRAGLVGRMPDRSWVVRADVVHDDDTPADQDADAPGGDGH